MSETQKKRSFLTFLKPSLPFIASIIGGLLLFIGIWYGYNLFKINNVDVRYKGENISLNGVKPLQDQLIILLNTREVEQSLLKQNPQVENISVEKVYPSTLKVSVTLHKAILKIKTNEGFFFLAPNGRIVTKSREDDQSIPTVTFYQQLPYRAYQPGQFITFKDIEYTLFFVQKVQQAGLKINSIDIKGFYMLGLYTENKTLLFSAEKDKELQLYQFELIMKQFKIEGKDFKMLDVRFDKPIVTF